MHEFTALAPTVALHYPWDRVDDFAALRRFAHDHGVDLGTVNSNTFQDDDYKFGSLTHTDPAIRQKAIDHHFECIEIMEQTGSRDLKIWLADGTNYPGQGDLRARQDRLSDSLQKIYARLGDEQARRVGSDVDGSNPFAHQLILSRSPSPAARCSATQAPTGSSPPASHQP